MTDSKTKYKLNKDGTPDKRFKQGLNRTPSEKEQLVQEEVINKPLGATPLTSEEKAIADRIMSSDDSWQTITEADMHDFSLSENPFKLPPEAQKRQDDHEFAFRYIERKPDRIDYYTSLDPPARWWTCNATRTPFLYKYIDNLHGGVAKLDQLLMFKPWKMHQMHQDAKMNITTREQDAADISKLDGVREEWGEWESGEKVKVGGGDEVMAEYLDDDGESFDVGLGDVAA